MTLVLEDIKDESKSSFFTTARVAMEKTGKLYVKSDYHSILDFYSNREIHLIVETS